MTGVEDELRDVDSMIRQPDDGGLTLERRAADEIEKRDDQIRRMKALLAESLEAMNETTRRYRTMAGIAGNGTEVPGWVSWLERMQKKLAVELNREVQR